MMIHVMQAQIALTEQLAKFQITGGPGAPQDIDQVGLIMTFEMASLPCIPLKHGRWLDALAGAACCLRVA